MQQVYHCVRVISFKQKAMAEMYQVNIKGTENIVNACLSNKKGKLYFVSSSVTTKQKGSGKIATEKIDYKQSYPFKVN